MSYILSVATVAGVDRRSARLIPSLAMRLNRFRTFGIAVLAFAAGSLLTVRLYRTAQVRADAKRVFELRVYHAVPGKVPALSARFRDTASKLFDKHGMQVVGYWIPEDAPASDNTFIYILAHPSREEATKHWQAMRTDPEFLEKIYKQEQSDAKLVEKVDSTYMDPTDFSALK